LLRLCDRGLNSKKRAAVFAAVDDLLIKVDKLRVVHPTNGRHRVDNRAAFSSVDIRVTH
jgi:hypothetical protein